MAKRKFKVGMKKSINIPRVVGKTAGVIIALYVGNEIINQIGSIINCTQGPFNNGFKLIGWTIENSVNTSATCTGLSLPNPANNLVTDVSGAGVLSVIGVVGIASIVLEFVNFNLG